MGLSLNISLDLLSKFLFYFPTGKSITWGIYKNDFFLVSKSKWCPSSLTMLASITRHRSNFTAGFMIDISYVYIYISLHINKYISNC